MSGTHSGSRLNSRRKRLTKHYLLNKFGDGTFMECQLKIHPLCIIWIDFDTMTIDRIVRGRHGGTYNRNNIRAVCDYCNQMRD